MIKHIVMWKLKENALGNTKEANALTIKKQLEDLVGTITEIKSLEVGINFNPSEAAFDVVLYSEFENEESLNSYMKHPLHVKVADFVSQVRENRVVVDYQV
jgi:Stress responsive A/B Barrel Domain